MSMKNIVEKMLEELMAGRQASSKSDGTSSGRKTSAGGRPRVKDSPQASPESGLIGGSLEKTLRQRLQLAGSLIGAERDPGTDTLRSWVAALESATRVFDPIRTEKPHRVSIQELDLGGACTYEVTDGKTTHRGVFHFDGRKLQFGMQCSCGTRAQCEHNRAAIRELLLQAKNPGSFLEEKLMGSSLQDRKLRQQVESLQRQFRRIAQLPPRGVSPESFLAEETPRTKYLWNLSWDTGARRLQLRPVILTEKKNGGWSKGRELSLENFFSAPRDGWSELDRSIGDLFRAPLDYIEALQLLRGTDCFLLDREPAVIEELPLELFVEEVEQGLRITSSAVRAVQKLRNWSLSPAQYSCWT